MSKGSSTYEKETFPLLVFKKGTYTYEVSNGESKFKLEILRLKEFVIINTRTSLSK